MIRQTLRPLLYRLAPPVLRAAQALGLGPLPFVPLGALHPPQPPARGDQGGVITGWATPPAQGPNRVGLFWRGTLVAEALADRPRPDIHALGLAPVACGFTLAFPATVDLATVDLKQAPLVLARLDAALSPLASWPLVRPLRAAPPLGVPPSGDPMDRLRPLLAQAARQACYAPGPRAEIDPVSALTPRQARLVAPDPSGRTAYLAHVRQGAPDARHGPRIESEMGPDAELLDYLTGYAATRAATGLVAPLAASDLARLRGLAPPVPSAKAAGAEGTLCRWFAHGPGACAPEAFLSAATAPALHAYLAAATTPGPWSLSRFALWLLADRPAFAAVLSPDRPEHRRLWALTLAVEAATRPLPAALLPPETQVAAQADLAAFCAELAAAAAPSPPLPRLSAEGHRLSLPALLGRNSVDTLSEESVDVQIIGPFSRASGLGQATRATAAALATTGLTLRLVDAVRDHPTPGGAAQGLTLGAPGTAHVTVLHQNLDTIPATLAYGPDFAPGPDTTLIGFGFWELDRPPADHALGLRLIDQLWAASPFGRDIYAGHPDTPPDLPIDVAPLPVLLPARLPGRAEARAHLAARLGTGLSDDACVFFASFDSYSFIARKNPGAVVAAFRAAFPETFPAGKVSGGAANVRLVLKTHNRAAIGDPAQTGPWRALLAAIAADPRITLIDETLPFAEVLALKSGADAYVSLHRAEGWGFGLIEAAALGLPLVATDWSANRAFMDPATSWLIPARPVPVAPGAYLQVPPGALWGEPDAAAAAAALAAIAADPGAARTRAAAAQARTLRDFSPRAVGAQHLARLAPLLPPRG